MEAIATSEGEEREKRERPMSVDSYSSVLFAISIHCVVFVLDLLLPFNFVSLPH